jgi:ABC-type multidrug transport system fused ATPase/permease subunit
LVQDAIDKLMKDRTVVIIAHRLSTVKDADKIAVIKGGVIVDTGSHDQLLATSEIYGNLVRRQMNWTSSASSDNLAAVADMGT